jgi:alginate O-acetyltransferase complex protein AlgI
MLFPTLHFLGFFCVVFTVYWALPRHHWRMLWLLASSCAFYMSWNPWFILLLIGSTSVDYFVALRLATLKSIRARNTLLTFSIVVNLGILAYFKYTVFALDATHAVLNWFGVPFDPPLLKIILPLGISFYTFEAISYVIDVYRGKIPPIRNPLNYALYIFFFPHLVAGPIVRSGDFLPQLQRNKRFSWLRLQFGVQLILLGLIKKAVMADHLGFVIDPVFAHPENFGSQALWLASLAYSVQIYCDFSGYSDMAIGLAHSLGFKLPTNFNMPYFAASLAEFWARWHISLSSWLRDYLYVPLGGNRHGRWKTYRNLILTMTLGGFWHGASWNYVTWGFYNRVLLAGQRAWTPPRWFTASWTRLIKVPLTFLAVLVGMVLVRSQTFSDAGFILAALVRPTSGSLLSDKQILVVSACLLLTFLGHLGGTMLKVRQLEQRLPASLASMALAVTVMLFFFFLPTNGQPFIYFQF